MPTSSRSSSTTSRPAMAAKSTLAVVKQHATKKAVAKSKGSSSSVKARKAPASRLTAPQVLKYLQAHPHFFETHAEDLANLVVPAKSGNLLSLHAHKAKKVVQKAETLQTRYRQFIDAARQNAAVTESIHAAVLGAMACGTPAQFRKFLQSKAEGGFQAALDLDACHMATTVEPQEMAIICPTPLVLGPLDPALHRPLFGANTTQLKSVCLMRLNDSTLLALASLNPARFHAGQATQMADFLRLALASHWGHIASKA